MMFVYNSIFDLVLYNWNEFLIKIIDFVGVKGVFISIFIFGEVVLVKGVGEVLNKMWWLDER